MKRFATSDGLLGLVCIFLALCALVIWIPTDIETGLVEQLRRQVRIGDAMLPVLGLGFVILGGLMTLAFQRADTPGLDRANLIYVLKLGSVLLFALVLMRWLGPALAAVFAEQDYRALRDTVPWKYIGFLFGSVAFVAGLMAVVEGRITATGLIIGLMAALALIAIYDLPFDDLLLPPNGDV